MSKRKAEQDLQETCIKKAKTNNQVNLSARQKSFACCKLVSAISQDYIPYNAINISDGALRLSNKNMIDCFFGLMNQHAYPSDVSHAHRNLNHTWLYIYDREEYLQKDDLSNQDIDAHGNDKNVWFNRQGENTKRFAILGYVIMEKKGETVRVYMFDTFVRGLDVGDKMLQAIYSMTNNIEIDNPTSVNYWKKKGIVKDMAREWNKKNGTFESWVQYLDFNLNWNHDAILKEQEYKNYIGI
jgi:hypothetical protein